MYLLCGPAELMPEEGLTRDQRRHLAALEVRPAPEIAQDAWTRAAASHAVHCLPSRSMPLVPECWLECCCAAGCDVRTRVSIVGEHFAVTLNPKSTARRQRRRGSSATRRWPRRRWTPRARAASPGALARTRWPSRRTPAAPPRRAGRPHPGPARRQPAGVALQCCGACREREEEQKGCTPADPVVRQNACWRQADWRAYAATHGLTDKQQKLATKIRKRELRMTNLQTEMEHIKACPLCRPPPRPPPAPGLCRRARLHVALRLSRAARGRALQSERLRLHRLCLPEDAVVCIGAQARGVTTAFAE